MIPSWASSDAVAAIEAIARNAGLKPRDREVLPSALVRDDELDVAIGAIARWFGLEAQPVELSYRHFARLVAASGPMLLRLGDGRLVALDAKARVIERGLEPRRVPLEQIRSSLFVAQEAQASARADDLLAACEVGERRRARVRPAMIGEHLKHVRLAGQGWQFSVPPHGSFPRHLRPLLPLAIALTLAHAFEYAAWIAAWVIVGQSALDGRWDRGWLVAWLLLLLTVVPLRAAGTWLQGQLAIRAGGLLKERLLYGALRLDLDEVRHQGAGQLLGRVVETEAMEALALSGGFLALVASVELGVAAGVALATGALLPVLMLLWILLTMGLVAAYWRCSSSWSDSRLTMTDDLVERMIGHRTRLAQEAPAQWHDHEDRLLDEYAGQSKRTDAFAPWFGALVPRGWLVAGMLAVAYTFVAGAASSNRLAILVGTVLVAFRAFRKFGVGAPLLVQAAVAWRRAAPIVQAGRQEETPTPPAFACAPAKAPEQSVVVESRDLTFRYPDRAEAVLRGGILRIRTGDRVLLDGPSGGGKSTLASIMSGLRKPTSGVLLAGGLDRVSVGADGWRRRVAMAPQFHENHLITGSLAFNLLMGRPKALTDADVREAVTVCEELGLGELLARMPSGIMQLVGEGGWQLSHGERSRVYLARALLQNASLIVLDECFAALDGVNLERAIRCVEKRAPAVLAIAHA